MQTETWQIYHGLVPAPVESSDGTTRFWEYNVDVACFEMCRLICRVNLPICFVESSVFGKVY